MELTIIVYDQTGHILYQGQGDLYCPVGVPFIEVDIPQGQHAISVDVSKTPHKAVLSDPPIDEKAVAIAELQAKMTAKDAEIIMVLAAMAETYEAVLPFLPPQY